MTIPRKFEIHQPVHIISRAVDGKKIFNNEEDCLRFIFQMYAINVGKPIRNLKRQDITKIALSVLNGEDISSSFVIKQHKPLVHVLDFSLVKNHNHLYAVPNVDNGIPILMRRLNNGFAQYFNLKHNRKGALFEGRYRAVIVKTQFQSDAVSRYISIINPLDIFQPGWRKIGIKNPKKAFDFLKKYKFSSFPDKIGERQSQLLASPEILNTYLTSGADIKSYQKFVQDFLKDKIDIFHDNHLFLE